MNPLHQPRQRKAIRINQLTKQARYICVSNWQRSNATGQRRVD